MLIMFLTFRPYFSLKSLVGPILKGKFGPRSLSEKSDTARWFQLNTNCPDLLCYDRVTLSQACVMRTYTASLLTETALVIVGWGWRVTGTYG